jgi:MFS family permease
MALAYLLLAWLAPRDIVFAAGFVVCSALCVELAVLPVANTFVAQIMPAHRLGFGFGLLGLSDVGGTVAGIMVGTSLYARAQHAGNLTDYWRMLGIICMMLAVVGVLWSLLGPRRVDAGRPRPRGPSASGAPMEASVRSN